MSLPRRRLDYALTVGPLLLVLLAFTYVPAVSGEYKKKSCHIQASCGRNRHMSRSPLLGNRLAARRRAPARWTRPSLSQAQNVHGACELCACRFERVSSLRRRDLVVPLRDRPVASFLSTSGITVVLVLVHLLSVLKISTAAVTIAAVIAYDQALEIKQRCVHKADARIFRDLLDSRSVEPGEDLASKARSLYISRYSGCRTAVAMAAVHTRRLPLLCSQAFSSLSP
ncbi:hypothetical protein P5V15_004686 [Pogonomyrmex californicus]